jgi:hypothetical protein
MAKAKAGSKESPIKCETSMSCKATAALEAEIKEELELKDKTLQELFDEHGKVDSVCD